MKTLSLRARLTLWYTFALLVVLSLFGADVLWQQGRIGLRRVDRELDALATTLANVMQRRARGEPDVPAAATEAQATVDGARPRRRDSRRARRAARRAAGTASRCATALPDAASGRGSGRRRHAAGAWRVHARAADVRRARRSCCVVASPLSDVAPRAARSAGSDGRRHPDRAAAGGGRRPLARVDRPAADHRHGARARRDIPLTGLEDLGQTDAHRRARPARAARSTASSRACARRCRRSVSSWPTRRTSCARRCR